MPKRIKKTEKIDEYLCYYAIIKNPILFREFFLPILFEDYHREIYVDFGNILSTKHSEQDLEKFITAWFSDWRNIPLEERIEKFFLLLDEGNWRGMHNKPNYISRLFKDVDYFDRVLLMWYREGGKKKQLAKKIIDELCLKIVNYYIKFYSAKWLFNKHLLRGELKSIAHETYLERLEKNFQRKKRYVKPSKKYITDFVQKNLQRYFEKEIKKTEKKQQIPSKKVVRSPEDFLRASEKARKKVQELRKFHAKRQCSISVRETIDIYLDRFSNGVKPRDIAKVQGIRPNTVSKRIERFKKEARKSFPKNSS